MNANEKTDYSHDLVPVLPFTSRGVPVIRCTTGEPDTVVRIDRDDPDRMYLESALYTNVADDVRVDLTTAGGFAYALRYLLDAVADEDRARATMPKAWETAQRMWHDYSIQRGRTTDADRIDLARALTNLTDRS